MKPFFNKIEGNRYSEICQNIAISGESAKDGNMYHIWIDANSKIPQDTTLYLNPPHGTKYRGEGWFPTRHLNQHAACNRRIVAELLDAANKYAVQQAIDAFNAEKERDRQALLEAQRVQRLKEAGPKLYAALTKLYALIEAEAPAILDDGFYEEVTAAIKAAEGK